MPFSAPLCAPHNVIGVKMTLSNVRAHPHLHSVQV